MRSEVLRWGGELDEALLTAIVDFTIRVGRADLLPKLVKRRKEIFRVSSVHIHSAVSSAFTEL